MEKINSVQNVDIQTIKGYKFLVKNNRILTLPENPLANETETVKPHGC